MLISKNFDKFVFLGLLWVCFLSCFLMINSVSATDGYAENKSSDSKNINIDFENRDVLVNKKSTLVAKLKYDNGSYVSNKLVRFYIYDKNSNKNKIIGKSISDSKGQAIIKYKFTKLNNFKIIVMVSDGMGSSLIKQSTIHVYKSFLKIQNKAHTKSTKINIKSYFINQGSSKTSFVVKYKLPSYDIAYSNSKFSGKSNADNVKVFYNGGNFIYLKVKNLKKGKKLTLSLNLQTDSGPDYYVIKPSINKNKFVKVTGNNIIKFKTKIGPIPIKG